MGGLLRDLWGDSCGYSGYHGERSNKVSEGNKSASHSQPLPSQVMMYGKASSSSSLGERPLTKLAASRSSNGK